MKFLLDAHALIWTVDNPPYLSSKVITALQDPSNDLYLSAGTIWEISIKVGLRKLNLSLPFRQWMNQAIFDLGLMILPITVDHADAQATLPHHHGDPFDRLLVAHTRIDHVQLVSRDSIFDQYETIRFW